jgi:hypothetical protein
VRRALVSLGHLGLSIESLLLGLLLRLLLSLLIAGLEESHLRLAEGPLAVVHAHALLERVVLLHGNEEWEGKGETWGQVEEKR